MAIMSVKPTAEVKQYPRQPNIQPQGAQTVIVDNSITPKQALITHVAGIALKVDYYKLVVNKDNALYSQDIGQTSTQQQYIKYKDFELRQQGSLNEDQNDEDKVFVVRGTAIAHSGLIPNEGDMFVTDVGDGRAGVFNIVRSQRLSIMGETVFQIEYSLAYFVNDKQDSFNDLEKKVIQTYFYIKKRLDYREDPFVTTEENAFINSLNTYYREMCGLYYHWFFSKEFAAYILPGQTSSIFDYFLYRALRSLFTDDYFGVLQKHQAINIEDDDLIARKLDLFSVLLERSAAKFEICDQRVGVARTGTFSYEGATNSIRYTGIRQLIYPVSTENRIDIFYNRLDHGVLEGPLLPTPNTLNENIAARQVTEFEFGDKKVPLIKPVSIDDYYILSKDFYHRTHKVSVLEDLVLNYIDGKACNTHALKVLCDNYRYWPALERFYYIPLLMILIKSVLKDV